MRTLASLLRTRRRRLVAAAAVVLVASAAWYVGRSDAEEATATTATAEATTTTLEDTVTGSGTLAARRSSTLAFDSSGTVTKVRVEAGDTVRKGEVLATIDTTALEASLASAEAQLTAAETTAVNDGDETSAQQSANAAKVESALADVAAAQDALEAATLTAPFAGTVASVGYETGDRVGGSSGSSGSSGSGGSGGATGASTTDSAGITVITPRRFVLTASVSAADVERIEDGMQAQVTPTGATEPVFGTLQSVGRVAEVGTDGTATFPVTVELTGEQEDLYAGTTADVSIVVESRADVLTVPTAAITTEDGQAYVTRVTDGKAERTAVEIGDTAGMSTEIVKGLEEGDTVRYEQAVRRAGGGAGRSGEQGGFPAGGMPPGGAMPGQLPGGNG